MATEIGYGEELDPRNPWVVASQELTPDKSLTRIASNARFTVATVTLVGTLLTGLGTLNLTSVKQQQAAHGLALGTIIVSTAAVCLALSYLTVRRDRLNISDLGQVQQWFLRELRRSWLPTLAGWLLILAVLLAAAASLITILTQSGTPEPRLSISASEAGPDQTVSANVLSSGLSPGSTVAVSLIGVTADGKHVLLYSSRSKIGRDGKGSAHHTMSASSRFLSYRLSWRVSTGRSASVSLP